MADAQTPFVPKGERRFDSTQTCGYQPSTAGEACGKPGAWHVMWDAELDNSITCNEHMELIQRRWMYIDRHPITSDCTMPGALWIFLNDRCEYPSETSAEKAVVREVPA
ncbi:hypothetical protein [Streptomyces indicus]|uniref:Uncharacterized protein n=1 Tax=Streptomyces indicus TaxID=417292 RepID=A0A1G9ISH1_9ACTN|nr:hypothetical protein [Streptomyces indicus]SDL27995.1 hypothetical protein SAMN05421806_12537 [Streptomyces indicus]